MGKLTPFVKRSTLCTQVSPRVRHLYHLINLAPKLGLESMAEETFTGRDVVNRASMVEKGTKGKEIMEEVKTEECSGGLLLNLRIQAS